jgi:hypothetical protein
MAVSLSLVILMVCCLGTGLISPLHLSTALNIILFLQQTLLEHKISVPDVHIWQSFDSEAYLKV